MAADRDEGAVRAATANAARAGVADLVHVRHGSLSQTVQALRDLPGPGLVLTNPPYGARVGAHRDLRDLYAALGTAVREQLPGWSLGMLVADRTLASQTRLPLVERFTTTNGGIDVAMLTYAPEP